ncbi:MAG: YbaK/EbsC family protein, partial [Clostridia bacterium]|nr:YbaK/EbsC family protein [Clostridia bacterium]
MENMKIYNSAPSPEGRLQKEIDAFNLLDRLNIPYERVEHEAAMTIDDCGGVDNVLGTELCKNLFLTNSAKTAYYLLLLPGDKAFKTKEVSRQIGSTRLSF